MPNIIPANFDKESVGKAIGRIATGVFVITMDQAGERDGIMASWVCQAGFEPPMLTVCVHKDRHILELMGVGKSFTVNVLGKANMDAFKNFAKPFAPGLDRFEGLNLLDHSTAGPIIADCLAYMHVTTKTMVEAGDHIVVVGQIVDGKLLNGDGEPMVHLRKNGFQY
jgi:flavin reductase (DIM6/NTAB) family NADH-FMN oxidoreductase RutF